LPTVGCVGVKQVNLAATWVAVLFSMVSSLKISPVALHRAFFCLIVVKRSSYRAPAALG
jgi:hypothetical protein